MKKLIFTLLTIFALTSCTSTSTDTEDHTWYPVITEVIYKFKYDNGISKYPFNEYGDTIIIKSYDDSIKIIGFNFHEHYGHIIGDMYYFEGNCTDTLEQSFDIDFYIEKETDIIDASVLCTELKNNLKVTNDIEETNEMPYKVNITYNKCEFCN